MALNPLYTLSINIGNVDVLDADLPTLKGGEVVGLTYVDPATDLGAADVDDGYTSVTTQYRPAWTKQLVSGMRPLGLADTGTAGYGALLGQACGANTGLQSVNGTQFGPPIDLWSGKSAVYTHEGLYAVTLDAVDVNENTGLQPTNTTLVGNAPLYATSAGLLTPNVALAFEAIVVARFVEFQGNGALVTTPNGLRVATNAGTVVAASRPFTRAVIYWRPEV